MADNMTDNVSRFSTTTYVEVAGASSDSLDVAVNIEHFNVGDNNGNGYNGDGRNNSNIVDGDGDGDDHKNKHVHVHGNSVSLWNKVSLAAGIQKLKHHHASTHHQHHHHQHGSNQLFNLGGAEAAEEIEDAERKLHSNDNTEDNDESLQGMFGGVYLPVCETAWGVIIFLKFGEIAGNAGVLAGCGIILLAALTVLLVTSSLSAIVTNGYCAKGGAYAIIAHSLGVAVGGAIGILYFVGMTLLSTVEVLGFSEALHKVLESQFDKEEIFMNFYWEGVILVMIVVILLGACALLPPRALHALGMFFMLSLILAFISGFVGVFATSGGWANSIVFERKNGTTAHVVTGLSLKTLHDNLYPSWTDPMEFHLALSYIFPSFIGVFSGANRSSQLRRPDRAIPRGTFFAVLTSTLIYLLMFLLLSAAVTREGLKNMSLIFSLLAWPNRWVTLTGLLLVGLGSAMQLLYVAPRILCAISSDEILPVLVRLKLHTLWNDQPLRALIVTIIIALPFAFFSSLDIVATVTTMCFAQAYGMMCFSTFLLSVVHMPDWRPTFQLYHWSTALLGFFLCAFIMFEVRYIIALVSICATILLSVYIQFSREKSEWGNASRGLRFRAALNALLGIEQELIEYERLEHSPLEIEDKNTSVTAPFRPHVMCLLRMESRCETSDKENKEKQITDANAALRRHNMKLLDFLHQLNKSRGLTVVATVVREPEVSETSHSVVESTSVDETTTVERRDSVVEAVHCTRELIARRRHELNEMLTECKVRGFVEVIEAPTFDTGKATLIQCAGLGAMKPNTILFGWPSRSLSKDDAAAKVVSKSFLDTFKHVLAHRKAMIVARGLDDFPDSDDRVDGTIDVWWVVQDGGFLLLTAFLLQRHRVWRGTRLRLFTVAEATDNSIAIERALIDLLRIVRIPAEVKVIEMAASDFDAFAYEWTVHPFDNRNAIPLSERATFPNLIDELPGASRVQSVSQEPQPEVPDTPTYNRRLSFFHNDKDGVTLHDAIARESSDAALVIINMPMPDHAAFDEPERYTKLLGYLSEGLSRVLFIHGTGRQVLGNLPHRI